MLLFCLLCMGTLQVLDGCICNRYFLFCIKLVALNLLVVTTQLIHRTTLFIKHTALVLHFHLHRIQLRLQILQLGFFIGDLLLTEDNRIFNTLKLTFRLVQEILKVGFLLLQVMEFLIGQVLFVFLGAQFLYQIVELVLHRLQGTLFFNKAYFLLFNAGFFGCDLSFQLHTLVHFQLLLLVQFFVGNIETFQSCFGEFYGNLLVVFLDFVVLLCFLGLVLQSLELVINFK